MMDDPWEDQQVAADLISEIASEVKPDVIHFNGYALAAKAAWRVPVIIGAHSCVLSWWKAVKREPAPSCLGRYRNEVAAGLAAADAVVAPTQALLSVLEDIYQVDFHGLVIRSPSELATKSAKFFRSVAYGTRRRTSRFWIPSRQRLLGRS